MTVGPITLPRRLKRLVGWPVVALIFWFWWRSLAQLGVDWGAVLAHARGAQHFLLLGLLSATGYVVLQALAWRLIVAKLVLSISWLVGFRLWTVSNFARYLPGSVWHLAGRIYLGREEGVDGKAGALSVLLEQGLQLLGALLLVVLTLPWWPSASVAGRFAWLVALVPLGLAAIHPRLFFPIVNFGLGLLRREPVPARLRYRDLLGYLVLYIATNATNALVLVFAVHALGAPWTTTPVVIGAAMVSWVAGVVSPVTPGGLGLREGLVTLVLGPVIGADVAAVGALLWRAANILTEAFCLLFFTFAHWLMERPVSGASPVAGGE